MAGLCEGGNEPSGSLKANISAGHKYNPAFGYFEYKVAVSQGQLKLSIITKQAPSKRIGRSGYVSGAVSVLCGHTEANKSSMGRRGPNITFEQRQLIIYHRARGKSTDWDCLRTQASQRSFNPGPTSYHDPSGEVTVHSTTISNELPYIHAARSRLYIDANPKHSKKKWT
ncbi:hypothetical protein ANN_11121 [Periplaneta americana]|uniref:Uncharacterized protein n=1 Tax=Periplaneta americana TaxID=6978 RepID=A0ABQ8T441_PERAM|nr:hypothetical protein ANN_11121 [Periplaneta americana]